MDDDGRTDGRTGPTSSQVEKKKKKKKKKSKINEDNNF